MSSDEEDFEKLLEERAAENKATLEGKKKILDKLNSKFKQPVYTSDLPDTTPAHHESVFSLDLDPDKPKISVSNVRPSSPVEQNEDLKLPKLVKKWKNRPLHLGGRKSKKNRRRGSRRRVRSSRRR
jgi:hypothetical protein